jgi:hypothetical protein
MLVVRLQAQFRGFLGRKRVKRIRSGGTQSMMRHNEMLTGNNFENVEVQQIREQLGDFEYGKPEPSLGMNRESRPMISLENGARYEGEWL